MQDDKRKNGEGGGTTKASSITTLAATVTEAPTQITAVPVDGKEVSNVSPAVPWPMKRAPVRPQLSPEELEEQRKRAREAQRSKQMQKLKQQELKSKTKQKTWDEQAKKLEHEKQAKLESLQREEKAAREERETTQVEADHLRGEEKGDGLRTLEQ